MLNRLRGQEGGAAVIVMLAMTCLMGMSSLVVDVGYLYLNKAQLQNMADAAVLAGAQELAASSLRATSVAGNYAAVNGKSGDTVQVTIGGGGSSLTVKAARQVALFFAPVLGISDGTVSASATATISAAGSAGGVMPIGVVKQSFVYGQTYTLKQGGGSGYCGNYGPLALGGNGATVYRNNLDNGYSGVISVGDWVPTETGNMVGPTNQGIGQRISRDAGAVFATVQPGSSRIVLLPIIDSLNVNGSGTVLVDGFAVFFLQDVSAGVITGNFMQMSAANTTGGGATGFGLYNIQLTR